MIVRKLRLRKGWSQEQLAELTGLSVRTIQRAERGQKMSLETARSFAAVFEVHITTFDQGETKMTNIENPKLEPQKEELLEDEKQAIEYIKGVKEFLTHLFLFVVFALTFLIFKPQTHIELFWPFVGWALGVVAHGVMAFELIQMPWQKWEKKMIEKKLGRKL